MPGLHELQKQFSENLFNEDATDVLAELYAGDFEASQRIQIYRNNVFTAFTDALRAVYPVVERLVGDGFFLYATNQYIKEYPSTDGNLHDYGQSFPAFLEAFPPAQSLGYLPDTARLEWYCHEVYHELEGSPLDLQALSRVASNLYGSLRFEINPACRLLQSAYPILDIWRVNQDGYEGDQRVDINSGGTNLLVTRDEKGEVELHSISTGDYSMLLQISKQKTLDDCLNASLSVDAEFKFDEFLLKYVQHKVLINFFTK